MLLAGIVEARETIDLVCSAIEHDLLSQTDLDMMGDHWTEQHVARVVDILVKNDADFRAEVEFLVDGHTPPKKRRRPVSTTRAAELDRPAGCMRSAATNS